VQVTYQIIALNEMHLVLIFASKYLGSYSNDTAKTCCQPRRFILNREAVILKYFGANSVIVAQIVVCWYVFVRTLYFNFDTIKRIVLTKFKLKSKCI
jgi:hypothetical protein